ncbi:16S rRNA (cytidine(1402)-2'-O)-methyltransferase [Acetobacterium woodii]|uniref:Ribosomal RNA small subunit methyltransferase I n=1 Tax=Acetobacterium woodii (strain ATCC 29683 / DSM 1030 / JCM 2381 / KCTC 1655 / WB1) TaxID=931626 RepID=H6LCF3_ACEWD|nr:16S rRNA (cytidine(1402)-2'-O)-methyltransferase [Acetobacterium woodii]AFA50268.1 ribosomal RNA small subunit methyltransferase I [Acetobacterium woodii DSM 1030]
MSGKLYIVGTPIGNLDDMTIRGLKVLQTVDLIAAEDTRHSIKLLNHFEISKKMVAYHQHNEQQSSEGLIELLKQGQNIALISDAGMPLISDPGSVLVKHCVENDIQLEVVPGPNAGLCGLVLSGLDTRSFLFLGFIGKENKAIKAALKQIEEATVTIVLYESPHRLPKTLELLEQQGLGHRQMSISREITKRYEESRYGTITEHNLYYQEHPPRGEYVLCIEGKTADEGQSIASLELDKLSIAEHLEHYLNQGLPEKEAMKAVAKDRNISRRDVYNTVKR